MIDLLFVEAMRHSVYFLASADLSYVKIGKSQDITTRIAGLRAGSPYVLLLVAEIDGYTHVERWLHSRFAANRAHGEWFIVDERLAEMILFVQKTGRASSRDLCPAQLDLDKASIRSPAVVLKITERDVIEMRGRYEHGESIQSIHRRYNPFSLREIGRAVIGLSWKEIALPSRKTPDDIKKLYKRVFLTKHLKRPVNARTPKTA